MAEDAEARADEDREVEGLLGLAAEGFPGRAVEGIEEIRLIVAILNSGAEPDDALFWLDGLRLSAAWKSRPALRTLSCRQTSR